ncbi:MAG: hypothetical protein IT270_21640 [Saprospiraceae bacterium]|nr:hypothetical protein [Saprospiraceae bacterium]
MRTQLFIPILLLLLAASCRQEKNATALAGLGVSQNSNIPTLLDRHEALRQGKEWDDVQNYYGNCRRELMADPKALEPRYKLAALFIQEARVTGEHPHYYPAALQMLNEILAAKPTDKDILFRALSAKAAVELSLHEFGKALVTAQEAVKINPYNAQLYGVLVDAHVELGQYKQAVDMADKMVSIRPDLRSYSRVSYVREIYGQVDGAKEMLELAAKAGIPGQEARSWALLTLGKLYQTYGEADKARSLFEGILTERPDYPFAIAALGELDLEEKKYDQAEKQLNRAVAIIPEVGFYESLAQLYRATGRNAEYQKLIPQIEMMMLEDSDKGHNMRMEQALLYTDLAPDLNKALTFAKEEYAKRPDNIDVNRLMARIYALRGEKSLALQHLEKAGVTGSKHPELKEIKKMLGS